MSRGAAWLAAALLLAAPLDARCDESGAESVVIQDASGRIVVVPAKAAASAPAKSAAAPARVAAPPREGAAACEAHDDLVQEWVAARRRVIEAQQALEASESIPLTGMGGYRDARIAGAERQLERAEARESQIDTRARDLGVPPRCLDDSAANASDE